MPHVTNCDCNETSESIFVTEIFLLEISDKYIALYEAFQTSRFIFIAPLSGLWVAAIKIDGGIRVTESWQFRNGHE